MMRLENIPLASGNRIGRHWWLLVSLLFVCVNGTVMAAGQNGSQEQLYTVLNPTGYPPAIERKAMAQRPESRSLKGRTIYLVDVTFDNGDVFLKEMQKWFTRNMPEVKTIFREKKGAYYTDDPKLWEEIKANNGMMIMAIGH